MRKKIFGLLLALCLVVGLLPVVASAATPADTPIKFGFNTYKLTGYDTPIYTVNYSKTVKDTAGNEFTGWGQTTTDATEENYNAKYFWKTGDQGPTLILRGFKMDEYNNEKALNQAQFKDNAWTTSAMQTYAITTDADAPLTIIITGEDSLIECKFGITFKSNTTITSEGDAKLVMDNASSCIASNNTAGASLTLNANLDLNLRSFYNSQYGGAIIHTYQADLTINGGTIVTKTQATKNTLGIAARSSGNLVINGGNVTTNSGVGTSATNGAFSASGKVIINGGVVNANPDRALGIYGKEGITINGGEVNISSPYYGMNAGVADAPADITINGGTVEIVAGYAFYKAPVLGTGVDGLAGIDEENADYYDDSMYKKPWVKLSTGGVTLPTTEPTTAPTQAPTTAPTTVPTTVPTTAPTTAPTKAPTTAPTKAPTTAPTKAPTTAPTKAPTTAPTKAPTTAPTKAPTTTATKAPTTAPIPSDNTDSSNSSDIFLWIAAAAILVVGAAAVVVILKKKK